MYYLFIRDKKKLENFKALCEETKKNIEAGKTPVFSETRCAKTSLIETIPYQLLSGFFLIISTIILSKFKIPEIISVAVVLIVQGFLNTVANFIFTYIKHWLHLRLCKRMGIEPTERNIAVFESLEYQSV